MGVGSAIRAKPTALLDYGAGDGKVLIEAIRNGLAADTQVVAFEPVARFQKQLLDAASEAGLSDQIELVSDRAALCGRSFDYILCLSVLEHMPLPERIAFYEVCKEPSPETALFSLTCLSRSDRRSLLRPLRDVY